MIANLYSLFLPFITTLWDIRQYNIAYYWAISSIERAELVLRYHSAWFEWTWWWIWTTNLWWSESDDKINDFWLISDENNWMRWNIKSRSAWSIPEPWKGNIDLQLRDTLSQSQDYNKFEYHLAEEFVLDLDNTTDVNNFYRPNSQEIQKFTSNWSTTNISANIRLPKKIENSMAWVWLDTNWDLEWDWIWNDWVVLRSISWNLDWEWDFKIQPTVSVDYNSSTQNADDSVIREDVINSWIDPNIKFKSNINPIEDIRWTTLITHSIIPENSSLIDKKFQTIFNDSNISDLHLKISIVNLLKNSSGNIYPFLEYKINFDWVNEIPDRFYHIYWNAKVWEYNININFDKPVIDTSPYSDFTVLF